MKINMIAAFLLSMLLVSNSLYANPDLWSEVSIAQRSAGQVSFALMPDKYSLYQLDTTAMQDYLTQAARSSEQLVKTISVPLPNREMIELTVVETSVMAAELAAKYPQIKTYKVSVVGRPSVQGVVDVNELGFHAMLFLENGRRLFIDPRQSVSGEIYYISYYDSDYHPENKQKPRCELEDTDAGLSIQQRAITQAAKSGTLLQRTGTNLRTYRLALAATGEYTTYQGGTVPLALSAMTTSVARVNQIYERDLAVTLELVANNDQIIYTDASTDPYSDNNDSNALLNDNQPAIDNAIGSANYDVGHVITHNAGGGVASLGSVCANAYKASAMTGHNTPQNDPFDIDYFAHELGHQFGGNHSFNATLAGCNRNISTSWEIGNGITIMGYAGVCDTGNDVASNSIAMFHTGNIRQMTTFIDDSSQGASCGTASSLSNQQPTANAGIDYTIPAQTPFQLVGTGTDPDSSDTLSYSWEQIDLGTIANISDGDVGDNPLFRVFLPNSVNTRLFPQLNDIVNNTQTKGEILPTTSRNLNFTFTVRDQKGGVADDDVKLTVIKTTTPFKVTSHTTTATLAADSSIDVLWNVGDTQSSPINCTHVDILLSLDSGNTFASYLAQNTSNDGSETVLIPSDTMANSTSRIKVACHNNIFFDISDANLSISNSGASSTSTATTFNEGSTNHVNYFTLALSSALSTDASVTFETRDGTAIAGVDYIATTGTATIVAGEKKAYIGVTIIGDTTTETDETFSLIISNPVGGSFPNSVSEVTATHSIVNDD